MLSLRLAGVPATCKPGEWLSRPREGNVFTDTPATTLRRLVAAIDSGKPWKEAVREEYADENTWLYRIIAAPERDLFFRTHCTIADSVVLDVGSGWGQQTLALAPCNRVCAVEPNTDKLAFIRAVAGQSGLASHIWFINAEMQELAFDAQFDVATCIGVLEWAGTYAEDSDPRESQRIFLRRIQSALRPGGICVIGIENRMALKYLLGARDDHTGTERICNLDFESARSRWHATQSGELRVVVYSDVEYRELLSECGFSKVRMFAAFPDYKLPAVILPCDGPAEVTNYISDGSFTPEHDGWNGADLENQDELRSHYRSLAQIGIAHHFAPSYFLVAHK